MVDQGWPGSGTSQSMPSFVMRYGLWPSARRGVDELGDDVLDELGIAERQRLPVLEDVPPVPLEVRAPGLPSRVAHLDVEAVPGPAGIAVAAAEGEGEVLVGEPLEVRVAAVGGRARSAGPATRCAGSPSRNARWRSQVAPVRPPDEGARSRARGRRSRGAKTPPRRSLKRTLPRWCAEESRSAVSCSPSVAATICSRFSPPRGHVLADLGRAAGPACGARERSSTTCRWVPVHVGHHGPAGVPPPGASVEARPRRR